MTLVPLILVIVRGFDHTPPASWMEFKPEHPVPAAPVMITSPPIARELTNWELMVRTVEDPAVRAETAPVPPRTAPAAVVTTL